MDDLERSLRIKALLIRTFDLETSPDDWAVKIMNDPETPKDIRARAISMVGGIGLALQPDLVESYRTLFELVYRSKMIDRSIEIQAIPKIDKSTLCPACSRIHCAICVDGDEYTPGN